MAFLCCRFGFLNSSRFYPLSTHPLPVLRKLAFYFPYCPLKLNKSSHMSLLRQTHLNLIACGLSSSTSSSMEVPPEGYRRNVGICLINPNKKIFVASRLHVPGVWQLPQVSSWIHRKGGDLLGDGTEKAEFGEWSWMSPEQVVELAVAFKKPVYEEVMKIFSPYLQLDSDEV